MACKLAGLDYVLCRVEPILRGDPRFLVLLREYNQQRVKSFDEMVETANNCEFGLTCAFYTQDLTNAMNFIDRVEAGMVHVNSPTIGGEAQVPFGGVKGSGVGDREMSKEGLHFFTELKTAYIDYTGRKRETNIY